MSGPTQAKRRLGPSSPPPKKVQAGRSKCKVIHLIADQLEHGGGRHLAAADSLQPARRAGPQLVAQAGLRKRGGACAEDGAVVHVHREPAAALDRHVLQRAAGAAESEVRGGRALDESACQNGGATGRVQPRPAKEKNHLEKKAPKRPDPMISHCDTCGAAQPHT